MTNIYAITALLLVLLTYGMETGFFRFANKSEEDAQTVYSTTLLSVGSTSILFIVLCLFFLNPIASFLEYGSHPEFVAMMAIVVGMDAFQCIPFAYLRYKKRPIKFAALKLLFIFTNILMNIFFFVWAPALYKSNPELVSWFYDPSYGAGYAFLANLICTSFIMLLFIPDLISVKYKFDADLLKRMLKYSFPILILGIAGILNQTADKILYPFLVDNKAEADVQLGIYGAASKIAMIMAMFTQAFRFAYEPFVFGKSRDKDSKEMYATAMKFFIIFTLLAFLAVMFYMDILKHIIRSDYWPGLRVVPIVMAAEMFMGIYFNLSFWYKLIDETRWGAYFSIIGCSVVIILNVVFVPIYGYMACAWAGFAGYATAMILSYVVGQKKYPINYDLRRIGSYALLAIILYIPAMYIPIENMFLRLAFRTLLLCLFVTYIIKKDFPLNQIPIINRLIRK